MPKMKTCKSAAKRVKRTKNGKLKRHMAFARHLLTHKSSKRRRRLRQATTMSPEDARRMKSMLPYG